MKKRKYVIFIFILIPIVLLLFYYKKFQYDENFVKTLPNIQVSNDSNEIKTFINYYSLNSKIGEKKILISDEDIQNVAPNEKFNIKFADTPHEYNLSIILDEGEANVTTSDDSFNTPKNKGKHEYILTTRWYDKGTISYKFTVNVVE
ncbi:hypothetical protein Curi_c19650 [Gottschalkia acidurici 9a]|uniref:Uncharacterized protein n=1 Tax=Gottschalkia acidurici (strain ATCC 7906 / DSM 604 / BCRC 14475 / CIP 104303 / KCTC 5404 / NCIMB 10678 / 9a) TaxID=1128398 RepID=K0B0B5_GOTA9|nr:hypothetical protein [Gottschalkia acidurici]AFS78969.1 hypothetical protein Curi_c19650 [Gottschalkia acidurici 9a]